MGHILTIPDEDITVLVPVSPIPSHPSTRVLSLCLASVRERLPDTRIVIMADGVRPELEHRTDHYGVFLDKVRDRYADDQLVELVEWADWQHQARMTRHALDSQVDTPLVLFMESDTTLWGDIGFDSLVNLLHGRHAKVVRFHHEAGILPSHEWLSVNGSRVEHREGVPLIGTAQFSARPHLARADWYRWALGPRHFHPESRAFIEDVLHGAIIEDWRNRGLAGWKDHLLWIYAEPDANGSIKHSETCDGRGDDPKAGQILLPLEGA